MQEEYLHYLWRMKRLRFNQLKLANGSKSEIQIKDPGWYNFDAGPDFFNGTVVIDGLQWSGNIEMHIKSSDWYSHQHHLDEAYNNVILHVVFEHDKEVLVKGKPLPTIELKSQIDSNHYENYRNIISNQYDISCGYENLSDSFALTQQIDLSFLHRVERKGLILYEEVMNQKRDKNAIFYAAVFKGVGGRTNALPMEELVKIIPYSIIMKEKWDTIRVEAIVFGCAGMLNQEIDEEYYIRLQQTWRLLKNKYKLQEMQLKSWKNSGMRPYSFPEFILAQLSAFLLQFDFSILEKETASHILNKVFTLDVKWMSDYWKTHFVFGKISKPRKLKFSKLFINNIIINGVVPYLVVLKHLTGDFSYIDKIIEIMDKVSPEKNTVMRKWENIGVFPKNAIESQGLLELYNEFCIFKKCLSCKVGASILEK